MTDGRSSPQSRTTLISTNEATMQMFRISHRSSAQSAAFSLRLIAAIAILIAACGTASPAWCKPAESLWVADTDNNRIVELVPSDLKSSGTPVPLEVEPLNSANGLAFDKSGNLWVEAFDNFILEFTPAQLKNLATVPNPTPVNEFGSGADAARGCIFDHNGNLWIIDAQGAVDEFTHEQLSAGGSPSPSVRISSGALNDPEFGVFDKSDNLWLSNQGNSEIAEFKSSQLVSSSEQTPAVILSANGESLDFPAQLVFDHKGNLWAANMANSTVVMFAKKQLKASGMPVPKITVTSPAFDEPTGLAFDGKGNLWFSNFLNSQISKFSSKQLRKSGSPTPPITITGILTNSHQMTFGPVF
jgi:sugar lactone lactonase YvrE